MPIPTSPLPPDSLLSAHFLFLGTSVSFLTLLLDLQTFHKKKKKINVKKTNYGPELELIVLV